MREIQKWFRYYAMYWVAVFSALAGGWLILDMTGSDAWGVIVASLTLVFVWILAITTEETNRWLDANNLR